jgi:hypothetical protein
MFCLGDTVEPWPAAIKASAMGTPCCPGPPAARSRNVPFAARWAEIARGTSRLGALVATRWILATLRRARGRIGARGNGGVARAAVQSTLKLSDPLILTRDPRDQRLDLRIHTQEHPNHLPTRVIDRLRLNPIHNHGLRRAQAMSHRPTERLQNLRNLQGFMLVELGGLEPPTSWVRSRRSPN